MRSERRQLVIEAVCVAAVLLAACTPPGTGVTPSTRAPAVSSLPAPSAPSPTGIGVPPATPSTPPLPGATANIRPPAAIGPVAAVGVLVVRDAFGTLYRYDGVVGTVDRLTTLSTWSALRHTAAGVYEVGTQGGVIFVPWRGAPRSVDCDGFALSVSKTGTCTARRYGPDGGLVVWPATASRATLLFPTDWGTGSIAIWDPTSRRLALDRIVDQRCMRCANALYVLEPDGTPRLLYDTHVDATRPDERGMVCDVSWSPDARLMALSFCHGAAGLDARVGHALSVLEVASGQVVGDLGVTPGSRTDIAWSSRGMLAFVTGTLDALADASLNLFKADGRVRVLDADGSRPVWDASGDRIGWVRSDGTGTILDLRTETRATVRCSTGTVAGLQFSATTDALLLLCRLPIAGLDRYEVRYVAAGTDILVLRDLGGTLTYPLAPDFADVVVWSDGASR